MVANSPVVGYAELPGVSRLQKPKKAGSVKLRVVSIQRLVPCALKYHQRGV
jgi:hypothetical protein